ncbi:hypothetical protein Tco_0531780 [Tanacetum coccineum]
MLDTQKCTSGGYSSLVISYKMDVKETKLNCNVFSRGQSSWALLRCAQVMWDEDNTSRLWLQQQKKYCCIAEISSVIAYHATCNNIREQSHPYSYSFHKGNKLKMSDTFSIYYEDGNPARVSIKQALAFKMRHSMRMLAKDTRSQDGIDDEDNDKGSKSRSQSMKEQTYNKEERERPRPHELKDKSNLMIS